ncbi:MAG TPA: polyphosphate kinase 2 family protein [Terrimesophilobacter sp.]|nr:polyphosphate kinase 2 family protein [Terrimesophilobacter sp.]
MAKNEWQDDPSELLRATATFQLSDIDPGSTPGFEGDKDDGEELLAQCAEELAEWQEKLFAESRYGGNRALLLVLQAMDTAGKGGIVRHVAGAFDPKGVAVASFGVPTPEELEHDFLWRIRKRLPAPGIVGVFDRSHYEDVLVHRVRELTPLDEIEQRYGTINDFEREVVAGGTQIVKVMLHISPDEQKERLAERLDRDDKHWKYKPSDVDERMLWPAYQEAYQLAIERTTTDHAPWFVVPADSKWYARIAVQRLLLDALERMDPQWPDADFDVEAEKKRLAAS